MLKSSLILNTILTIGLLFPTAKPKHKKGTKGPAVNGPSDPTSPGASLPVPGATPASPEDLKQQLKARIDQLKGE